MERDRDLEGLADGVAGRVANARSQLVERAVGCPRCVVMSTGVLKRARIKVDAGEWLGNLSHNWTYIGYDEINYTYTPEGQELLAKFMAMQESPYYVRAHHLLCTGNCHGFYKWGSTNAYLEDDGGRPIYDWTFVDLIVDTILRYRCKPFVELGFMPQHGGRR
jgi:xylan 1,4-beta-xylosidase